MAKFSAFLAASLLLAIMLAGCFPGPAPVCGNAECQTGETAESCPPDCCAVLVTGGDLLLVSMSNLGKTPELCAKVTNFVKVIYTTEKVTAKYLELDSDYVKTTYGTNVEEIDWLEVKRVLNIIIKQEKSKYVVILGSPEVVPRPQTADYPCSQGVLSSDSWYIDMDGDYIPDEGLSISRIADYGTGSASILRYLDSAIKLHTAGGFTLSNKSQFREYCFGEENCYPTPPYCVDQVKCDNLCDREAMYNRISSSDYIIFEMHGNDQSIWTNTMCQIVGVQDIPKVNLETNNPVIQAYSPCETGRMDNIPNFAVEFLNAGAALFLGKTAPWGIPVTLSNNFPTRMANGERVGDALFGEVRSAASSDCNMLASVNTIALYGDPTLHIK